jgi:medium-chain acyl-[acyl-carrier-protein] hydrolase
LPANAQNPWFLLPPEPTGDAPRVYCFAHAGGNPRTFLRWQDDLGTAARIVPVCMPGRGHRHSEPAPPSIDEYADGAARAIDAAGAGRFLLFGHSLGALVAFEVARRLPTAGGLVASGCAAPPLLPSPRVRHAATLEGREFAEAVGFFGGLPPEIVAAEELHDLLLPGVQADFRLVAGYRYRPTPVLDVDVTLINGDDDPHVDPAGLDRWSEVTSAAVRRHSSPGGHFYFEQHPHAVPEVLAGLVHAPARPSSAQSELLI